MGRCPKEDNQEQNERLDSKISGCRCPADDGGKGTGRATDHDVLRSASLQPDGIDHDIEDNRGGEQRSRGDVDHKAEDRDRATGEDNSE